MHRDAGDAGSSPGSGRFPGEGNGNRHYRQKTDFPVVCCVFINLQEKRWRAPNVRQAGNSQ